MIFLGETFFSGRHALFPCPAPTPDLTAIRIFDGTYSRLFLSANPSVHVYQMEEPWDADTKMNADFSVGPDAGNSGFCLKNTDHLVIRRREAGTYDWVTIFVKEIKTLDDFNIVLEDTYARAGVAYEYCISSFLKSRENSYVLANVFSDFEGFYITDKNSIFGTAFDTDGCNTVRNAPTQTLELLNGKYAAVVSGSAANYDSGTISGSFPNLSETDTALARQTSLSYRNAFQNRLADKRPFLLKTDDGRIWLAHAANGISNTTGGHRDIRRISFDWVEIGDVNDMKTLYLSGLSDVDARWWI